MRAGISRVVVEVIILVIAVALALLIFSPIGSYIFGSLGRTSAVGGGTTISVLNAQINEGTNQVSLYIKNIGPNSIDGGDATTPGNWQVFINNNACTNIVVNDVNGVVSGGTWDKDEVLEVVAGNCGSLTLSTTSSYTIVVYGPSGTQTEYLYRGG